MAQRGARDTNPSLLVIQPVDLIDHTVNIVGGALRHRLPMGHQTGRIRNPLKGRINDETPIGKQAIIPACVSAGMALISPHV